MTVSQVTVPKEAPMKMAVNGPGLSGDDVVTEQRGHGTLVLEPARERLSQMVSETNVQVFRDEEIIARLERLEAAEDGLPPGEGE